MDVATRAYIAGFLDGDGSIIFQLVRRTDYALGFQVRASVCFYQKTSGLAVLLWLKERLKAGYLRERGDMSDYTIVGRHAVRNVLDLVGPYVIAKQKQVQLGLELLNLLDQPTCAESLLRIAEDVDRFSSFNYSKRRFLDANAVRVYLAEAAPR